MTQHQRILSERNLELRRIFLEMYGIERFMRDSKAERIHQDEAGALFRKNLGEK